VYVDASNNDTLTYRICQSFIDGLWGTDGSKYDPCGLQYSEMILNGGNQWNTMGSINLIDPFNGPADLLTPSVYFSGDVTQFLNGDAAGNGVSFKPPGSFSHFSLFLVSLVDDCSLFIPL